MSKYSNFPRVIRKYYEDTGYSHIFRNGMTQDKLAEAMATRLGADVDKSYLSRMFEGKSLAKDWMIEALSRVLKLTPMQEWELHLAAARDMWTEKGIKVHSSVSPDTLDLVITSLNRIEEARAEEAIGLAIRMLYDLFVWKHRLQQDEAFIPPLVRVFSLMQLEREKIINEIANSPSPIALDVVSFVDLSAEPELLADILSNDREFMPEQIVNPTVPLAEMERSIWQMRYRDLQSVEDIAQRVGRPVASVQSVLMMVRQKILRDMSSGTSTLAECK